MIALITSTLFPPQGNSPNTNYRNKLSSDQRIEQTFLTIDSLKKVGINEIYLFDNSGVNYISKILNFSGPFEHVPAPYGSVSRRCPDITKASNVLGYKPHHDWKEGVRVTTNWYKEYIINNGNIFE